MGEEVGGICEAVEFEVRGRVWEGREWYMDIEGSSDGDIGSGYG